MVGGRRKAGGGGDNDLVCQHDQSSAPQRVRGDNNDLLFHVASATIQSPAPQRVRGRREGEGGGMITTFFHAASTTTSSDPPRNGHTNDFVGGCFILCWRLFHVPGAGDGGGLGGLGVYRHLTQGRLSRQGLRSVASGFRVRVPGFGLEGSRFRFGSKLQGLGFLFRGLVHEEPRSRSSWDAPRHIGGSISQHRVPPVHHNYV